MDGAPSPSHTSPPTDASRLSYLVVSGGTGANSFASAFGPSPAFVLPVSDDGGSSAEILRCFGGPSIGDIRSRLIRLIPIPPALVTNEDRELQAIYNLMAHRFPADVSEKIVRNIWEEVVEGRGELWHGIGEDKKECIRGKVAMKIAFLVHFQTLNLRRAHKRFSFRNFSIGNGFLTGARDLFSNLPSAIFLFKSVAGVNSGVQVIPVINTNLTIAVQLQNQTQIIGQCNISHPAPPQDHGAVSIPGIRDIPLAQRSRHLRRGLRRDSRTFDTADSARVTPERGRTPLPGVDADDDGLLGNIAYTKGQKEEPLEARIERLFYINLYGQEIFPEPNNDFFEAIDKRDILVYSCGSLWTSIIPCLALRSIATALAQSKSLKAKVMLLNSVNDRETPDYTAMDYIDTVAGILRHYDVPPPLQTSPDDVIPWETASFITHVAYLEGAEVPVEEAAIKARGIGVVRIPRSVHETAPGAIPMFSEKTVAWAMEQVVAAL